MPSLKDLRLLLMALRRHHFKSAAVVLLRMSASVRVRSVCSPGPEPPGPGQRHSIHLSINTLVGVLKPPSHLALSVARLNQSSAKLILTLKNRELIHFGFLLRGFVEESIHDS